MKKLFAIFALLALGLTLSPMVFADTIPLPQPPGGYPTTNITSSTTLITTIESIIQWFAILVLVLAVIFFLYAAFLFITAGGSDDKIGQAKHILIYGVVGIIVAIISFGAVALIASFI